MKILPSIKLPVDHNLFLFGDVHEGTILFHERGFNTFLDMINSGYKGCSNNYAVHHGDGIEGITIDDKRYHPDSQPKDDPIPNPLRQVRIHINRLKPIKDKLLCMLESNHPEKLWRHLRVTQCMCEELDIPYGTWTAKLTITDRKNRLMYKSYHTHGKRAIKSDAGNAQRREDNMKETLMRHLEDQAGDTVLMCKAHVHKLLIREPFPRLYITDDGKESHQAYTTADHTADWIHPDHRWYVCTGSFLKLFGDGISGYAEKAEYKPNELGFAIARIRDRKIIGIDKIVV